MKCIIGVGDEKFAAHKAAEEEVRETRAHFPSLALIKLVAVLRGGGGS